MLVDRPGGLFAPRAERSVPPLVGVATVLLLSRVTFFGALWDARTVWMLLPLALPVLSLWVDRIIVPALRSRSDDATHEGCIGVALSCGPAHWSSWPCCPFPWR